MGFGSVIGSIGRAAGALSRSPIGKVAGLVPGLGTAVSAIGLAGSAYGAYKAIAGNSGAGASLPMLPGGAAPMLPANPGFAGQGSPIQPGDRSIFRNDPNVIKALEAFAIPKSALKVCYRAPKGFVVLHDQVGDAYGLPKVVAQKMGLWKAAKKPLLSVRDTNAIRRAGTAIKKLQHAEKMAKHIANWHSPRRTKNIIVTGGVVGKKGR